MNSDIRIHIEFWQHAKTRRMIRQLGLQGPVSLQILWCYAAKNRCNGILRDMDADDIEDVAGWPSDRRGEFFSYCTRNGWLDDLGGEWGIHEWRAYNPWAADAESRKEDGKRGAHERYHVQRGIVKAGCEFCEGGLVGGLKGDYSHPHRGDHAPAPAPPPIPSPAPVASEKRKISTNARARKEGKQITEGQFLYLADSIRKWRESHPQIGPGEADFDARFSDSFGFTWDYWTQAQERFGMKQEIVNG